MGDMLRIFSFSRGEGGKKYPGMGTNTLMYQENCAVPKYFGGTLPDSPGSRPPSTSAPGPLSTFRSRKTRVRPSPPRACRSGNDYEPIGFNLDQIAFIGIHA